MTTPPFVTNPALTETPGAVAIGEVRERLAVAIAVHGGAIAEPDRIALATALAQGSPVDAAVGAYRVLAGLDLDALPAALVARLVELCDLIAAHGFHGLASEAAATALSARAELAAR